MTSPAPATPILDGDDIRRALVRIAHEIVERGRGAEGLYLIGIRTRGVHLARRLAEFLAGIEATAPTVGVLDVRTHRDDVDQRGAPTESETVLPEPVDGRKVVLVDDVIFTGRTVRAALDIIMEHGRPESVWLAALIDRGHRELPIRPDFVGRNVPTSRRETVRVGLRETDGADRVLLYRGDDL